MSDYNTFEQIVIPEISVNLTDRLVVVVFKDEQGAFRITMPSADARVFARQIEWAADMLEKSS